MKIIKHKFFTIFILIALIFQFCGKKVKQNIPTCTDYSKYVNPFIGTAGVGNTFPGAVAPFGMIQVSPDTEKDVQTAGSGYRYYDNYLYGFSLTHLSGTGVAEMGDFLFVPSTGKIKHKSGTKSDPESGYITQFSHEKESASPGYYMVELPEHNVKVELTASERAGMMKFTFPESDESNVLIDLLHANLSEVIWSNVKFENDSIITGYHQVNGWAKERHIYFAAKFSKTFEKYGIYNNGIEIQDRSGKFHNSYRASGKDIKCYVKFNTSENEVIKVKVGISPISTMSALNNLNTEIPNWNFENVVEQTRTKWNCELQKIEIEASENNKTTFYTALYHSFLAPTLFEDVDGQYIGYDQKIHESQDFTNYSMFALWDTHHSVHPLFNLIQRDRNLDMVKSMLAHYSENRDKMLPIFPIYGNETFTMNGYHAVSVIADAYNKGIRDFDIDLAYEAMKSTANNINYDGISNYKKLGYVPFDQTIGAVSKTLEYAYDDYVVAQLASKLDHRSQAKYKEDYQYFIKSAYNYKNLFSPSVKFMRGKDSRGNWRVPFSADVYLSRGDFTQGSSRIYSFYVPHDIKGLIQLCGSKKDFEDKLDLLFHQNSKNENIQFSYGTLGAYNHGNEAAHHTPYLYNYVNKPWKTQKIINTMVNTFYGNGPDSIPSHDDSGQLSAWYIFSTLGFYPLCPPDNNYIIGKPHFSKATIHLSNGNDFIIEAKNLSSKNIYINTVFINDTEWTRTYFPFNVLNAGGKITFYMDDRPGENFGKHSYDIPPSLTTNELASSPFVLSGDQYFLDGTSVELATYDSNSVIRYTLDDTDPKSDSKIYKVPISINSSKILKARSFAENKMPSTVMKSYFTKATFKKSINPESITPKLKYEYFEGEFNSTKELKLVSKHGFAEKIDLNINHREDNFGFIFKGYLKVPAEGIYNFFLTSDDGSQLFIHNELIIDHDGPHSTVEKPGKIALTKGYHPIMIKYFEGTVTQFLSLEWSGANLIRQEILEESFYH